MYMEKFIIIIILLNCLLNVNGQYQFANKKILSSTGCFDNCLKEFNFYDSGQFNFTIPLNVKEIKVTACGGNGAKEKKNTVGNLNQDGGKGECLQALLNVKPYEVLFINVGGVVSLRMGGYNGSSTGGVNDEGASGATTIKNSSVTLLSAAGWGEG